MSALAIAPLLQAAAKQPANPVFHYHLGMAYLGEGNLDKANASLQKALDLNPNFDGAADARAVLA